MNGKRNTALIFVILCFSCFQVFSNANTLTKVTPNNSIKQKDNFCLKNTIDKPMDYMRLNYNRENDSLTLVALFNATDGRNWTNKWNLKSPMTTWYGVTLDEESGRVLSLELSSNNLDGYIPSEMGSLTSLVNINLSENNISNTIIAESSNLTNPENPNLTNKPLEELEKSITGGIWPGDMDNNGIVEITDLLYWGVANGKQGPARTNPSIAWQEQVCSDWGSSVNGVNGKHQDANGGGSVNLIDAFVIAANYGQTTGNVTPLPAEGNIQFSIGGRTLISDGRQVEKTYEYSVEASPLPTTPNPLNVFGLGCSIDLDAIGDVISVSFSADQSSPIAPFQAMYHFDETTETIDVAVTRYNGQSGINLADPIDIGTMIVVVVEDLSGDTGTIALGGNGIEDDGTLINSATNTSYVPPSSGDRTIDLPSVIANVTHANCSYLGTATLQISGGTEPYNIQWSTGATTEYIVNLEPGMYSVTVTDDTDSEVIIDFEVEDHYLTEDEEGNPIECNPVFLPEDDRGGRKEAQDSDSYLQQNHPNPFSETTTIPYDIPEDAKNPVLNIFDVTGNLKYTTPVTQTGEGEIQISQHRLPTGIYYYQLKMDERISTTRKMIIVR